MTFSFQRVYYEAQRLQDEVRHLREDNERRDKDAARERGLPPPNAGEAQD